MSFDIYDELTSEDSREARSYLRRLAGFVLLLIAVSCTSIVATKAYGADMPTYVAEMGENKLFIFAEPCALGGWFTTWRKARWLFQGKSFESCWKLQRNADGDLYVHTVDTSGDAGMVPLGAFRKQEAI